MPTATVDTIPSLTTIPLAYNLAVAALFSVDDIAVGETIGISIDDDIVFDTAVAFSVDSTANIVVFIVSYPGTTGVHTYRMHYPATDGSGTRLGNSKDLDWTSTGDNPYFNMSTIIAEGADEFVVVDAEEGFIKLTFADNGPPGSAGGDIGQTGVGLGRSLSSTFSYPTDFTTSASQRGLSSFIDYAPGINGPVNGTEYFYQIVIEYAVQTSFVHYETVHIEYSNIVSTIPRIRTIKDILGFTGMEHGGAWNTHLNTGNSGMEPGTIVDSKYGFPGKQFKSISSSTATQGYSASMSATALGGVAPDELVASMYWACESWPSGIDRSVIFGIGRATSGTLTGEAIVLRLKPDGYVEAGFIEGKNEQQRLTVTSGTPTGGAFALTYSGQTVTGIAFNASAATVQTALESLSNIAPGDVVCTGGPFPGTAIVVEFTGTLAYTNVSAMTATDTFTPGGNVTVATLVTGAGANGSLWRSVLKESAVSTMKICPERFIRADVYVDTSANPWVLKWSINNIEQADVSHAAAAVTNWSFVGTHGTGSADLAINSQTTYSTNFAVTNDGSQYPLGPRRSQLVLPNELNWGTDGVTHFSDEAGGTIDHDSWHFVSDGLPPIQDAVSDASANDGHSIRMLGGAGVNAKLMFGFEDFEIPENQYVDCVHIYYAGYKSATAPTNSSQFVVDVKYEDDLITARVDQLASGSTSSINASPFGTTLGFYRRIPPPVGGWTQIAINSLKVTWSPNTGLGAGDPTSKYYGLSSLVVGIHYTKAGEDFRELGCSPETWGRIAELRKDAV